MRDSQTFENDGARESGGLAARRAAFLLLDAVLTRRQALDDALERATAPTGALAEVPEARDRGFARTMVLTVLRRLGQIDQLIDRYMAHEPKGKAQSVRHILRLGTAQIIFLGTPPHAAVDTSVALAVALRLGAFKGLVNAILRRIAKEGTAIARKQEPGRLNSPAWLRERWIAAYGEAAARAIGEAHLGEPPLDLTLADASTGADWAARLGGQLLDRAGTVRLAQTGDVRALPGFAEGAWWVQDAAAALPARLLAEAAGGLADKRVIDLCAAPGGKTAQLAAMGASVTALDRSAPRLRRLSENLARLSLTAEVVTADAAEWRPEVPVDAILLDAPCSATGTLRRHPDIAHLKGQGDVDRLAALQRRLIAAAADMLNPGGVLVYATCSLQPEEGEEAVEAALADGLPLERIVEAPAALGGFREALRRDGSVRTLPYLRGEEGGCDGFFIARLRKRPG
ncbi:16S rRNA (cytosine(967)-C(5))-methyltransferase RsmB [Marivibrio halodurans]|uniref:16S rRNA (cytosine(967)-C(5))-methyltransferase n=1 Tax=Marivibrio halodurans TaxID=2039722 RepID=A0A8J7SB51_9PROT|nr:16S rRNA (cytosine(967)-C(5))-methyltransferase RsmB [Marivibrio halodurans]MBP5858772.1 16S rRNA (cytosine(967)-C(5))-methyltransferase RsmB [Marivibrio halodurans]